MKHVLKSLPFVAVAVFATDALGGITGTKHDLTVAPVSAGGICMPCHAPHVDNTPDEPVLWNHEVTTGATFVPYVTLDGDSSTLNGISKLCLSCHDGTVALDNYGGASGGTNFIPAGSKVGPDMTEDHPIGLPIPSAEAGYNSVDASNKVVGPVGGTIPVFDIGGTDMVECASCHEPHDNTITPFLRMSNDANALCKECHNK